MRDQLARLESYRSRFPVLLHGIGLSIGSAKALDEEYVDQLRTWCDWLDVPWFSEHLAYSDAQDLDGTTLAAGLTLPLSLTEDTVAQVGPKVAQLRSTLDRPVLLENNVYYFASGADDLGEPEVLNHLCRDWGANILLDVHNLYTNVRNNVMDAGVYLETIDTAGVLELHIAGGMTIQGFYVDAHCGSPDDDVWELLDVAVQSCPNVSAVTFELLGSWAPALGEEAVCSVLDRARRSYRSAQRTRTGEQ